MKRNTVLLVLTLLGGISTSAQEERMSSSINLTSVGTSQVTIPFDINAQGIRYEPTWGVDQAWIDAQNVCKAINHMGKSNIGIGRTAFRFTHALTNDSVLNASVISALRERNENLNKVSATLPITITADQEAGTDEYFVKNSNADVSHWAAMINSHVHWLQQNTRHPIVGISPFNEGDYWTKEEGASTAKQRQVAKLLKEQYPRCASIAIVGGNTLNNDQAMAWYTDGRQYYDWGNTHQLAGSFDNFAAFYQRLAADGKVGFGDEMHNVMEAMVGLQYGMTTGIWWGFDARARGEFCQLSLHGVRLAYGEHRNNWTAASVWRHDDGRVKAFLGTSERQSVTTSYLFVSPQREVYFDGYGPVKAYAYSIQGGSTTAYADKDPDRSNAERVIDITWGEDVPSVPVTAGLYKLVNAASGLALAYTASGSNIVVQTYAGTQKQQWNVSPVSSKRTGGDLSYFDIEAADNAKIRPNVQDYSLTSNASVIAWTQDAPTSNEQWALQYAENGYYYLQNRESALCLTAAGTGNGARVVQMVQQTNETLHKRQLWRLLPVDTDYETTAPAQPQGLTATPSSASVTLEWRANGEDDLDGYMILRADKATETWNTIARRVSGTRYVDNTCTQAVGYIYKVRAIDKAQNLSEASQAVECGPTGEGALIAHWPMDDNLFDATDNMMDAVSSAAAVFTDGYQGKALQLSSRFVQLPYEVANSDELTIAMWVNLSSTAQWQRLFDFGNDTDHYMFFTPNSGTTMRFAIKNGDSEQTVDAAKLLTTGQWAHLAVTIGKEQTVIYVNGQEVGSSTGITIRPSDIHPVLNYLGRSQFSADPYLNAKLDDVRIYNVALGAADVNTIMNGEEVNGIYDVQGNEKKNRQTVYSLGGQRLDGLRRGVNVVDGKKVLR